MLVFRRSVALVLSLLLVQLSLFGSSTSCVTHGDHASMPASHDGMPGDAGSAMNPAHTPDSSSGDCTTPWTPSDCSMPVSCAAPSLPTGATAPLAVVDLDGELWADPPLAARAPLLPPEPPPPRA